MNTYVILGNGAAGTHAAEAIRKEDSQGRIIILTDEEMPFYYRIRLNEFIAGEIKEEDLLAKPKRWYEDQKIQLRLRTKAVDGNPNDRVVVTENGERLPYDRLLVAAGSRSFIPPIKGSDKQGVFGLRSIKDAREVALQAKRAKGAVVIGGGLLGLEAGNALVKLGLRVTVVEFFPRLLPRQLDIEGAKRLQGIMEGMGFSFRLGAKTQEIAGEQKAEAVLLEGGERLPTELVLISAGVRPIVEMAKPLGLATAKGIKVDEYLRTNQPDIYAAGDVAEFRGIPYGIWPAAMEQGKAAGTNMAGGDLRYEGTPMANTLKVVGVDLASAGNIDAEGKLESRWVAKDQVYRKIVWENGRMVGCIMLGDKSGFPQITKAMAQGKDVSQVKDHILSEGFDFRSL